MASHSAMFNHSVEGARVIGVLETMEDREDDDFVHYVTFYVATESVIKLLETRSV